MTVRITSYWIVRAFLSALASDSLTQLSLAHFLLIQGVSANDTEKTESETGTSEGSGASETGSETTNSKGAEPLRIAIVGAGIGGGSAAHFLQRDLQKAGLPKAEITVFERNRY
jgi:hypothetical protein